MKKSHKRLLFFGIGLSLGIGVTSLAFLYRKAGEIQYYLLPYEEWISQRPAHCTDKLKSWAYADMRPQGSRTGNPLELSCTQAQNLPATDHFIKSSDGLNIHYRLYPAPKPSAPIWLYVPGIIANYLDGARYFPMARRLGFQLAIMELRNHGISGNNGLGASYGCHEKSDVLAVVSELQHRFPQQPLLLMGTSMGSMSIATSSAALMAQDQQHQIKAVILENPIPSLRAIVLNNPRSKEVPSWLQEGLFAMVHFRARCDMTTWTPDKQAQYLTRPVFVPISQHDNMVPVPMAQVVFQALPKRRDNLFKVYPHGDHAAIWNGQPTVYESDIRQFWQQANR